jgi:metal transporter CNNM
MLGSGDEAITYRKAELKTFVALGVEDKLADDELSLLGSVLEFSEKEVSAIMVSFRMLVVSSELMIDTY